MRILNFACIHWRANLSMHRHGVFLMLFLLAAVTPLTSADAQELASFRGTAVDVYHTRTLADAARETAAVYPAVKAELEATLGLRADFRPAVILLADRVAFEQVTGSRLIVAYAVPSKMLMVIDFPRASKEPFSARGILKHELCHLILHRHVPTIPRWLDEGICQWASDGLAEILSGSSGASLSWLSVSGSVMPLKSLDISFPQDGRGMALAYEQSRSVVDFITSRYGRNSVQNILTSLGQGLSVDEAFQVSLRTSLPALERDWQSSLGTWPRLVAYLMAHIYTVLFAFAALSTVAGYVRYRIRKRRLREEDEEGMFPDRP